MKHWHRVLPGKVLDVHYEETVADLETQVRRILDYCGLPFEEACVNFHQTQRAVRTASSEQVRQPLYTSGLGYWRNFEKHLGVWQESARGHRRRAAGDASATRRASSAVGPDFQPVDGVAHIHREIHRQDPLVRLQVVDATRRGR